LTLQQRIAIAAVVGQITAAVSQALGMGFSASGLTLIPSSSPHEMRIALLRKGVKKSKFGENGRASERDRTSGLQDAPDEAKVLAEA
jgi:hypothetical protein